jgi:CheY-like chemotaxis protein
MSNEPLPLDLALAAQQPGDAATGERNGDVATRLRDAQEAADRIRPIVGDPKVFSGSSDAESSGPVDIRRGRILVVDDEPMLCTVIERTLSADHDVTTVTSAKQALVQISNGERFDLILCDLMMPEMTGMDLHAKLQELVPDQAASMAFMTGGAFTENAQAFLARLPNASIEKPFKGAKLRELVKQLLA